MDDKIIKLLSNWEEIMNDANMFRKHYEYLILDNIKIEDYGYSANITLPMDTRFTNKHYIDSLKATIEEYLGCNFSYIFEKCNPIVKCKFIYKNNNQ
jgi:hypothetical protein